MYAACASALLYPLTLFFIGSHGWVGDNVNVNLNPNPNANYHAGCELRVESVECRVYGQLVVES